MTDVTELSEVTGQQASASLHEPGVPDVHAVQGLLETLRASGLPRTDPLRWHYLRQLAARIQTAPRLVQPLLLRELADAVSVAQARLQPAPACANATLPPVDPSRPFATLYAKRRAAAQGTFANPVALQRTGEAVLSPLAALNLYISQVARPASGAVPGEGHAVDSDALARSPGAAEQGGHSAARAPHTGLKNARRFGQSWSKLQSEALVNRALLRGPENAGPFNPHMLILRSLALMRELSPDYLHRFIQHADTLLWLEQAAASRPSPSDKPKPKPARSARSRQ